ncbi:hypothetical protein ACQEVF_57820 [Nonomuraea polychroma]|uniref:hypothetical protein n=1 Tax=Nonomuraea polychroma TaxID=46176 RepID=UPI003D90A791
MSSFTRQPQHITTPAAFANVAGVPGAGPCKLVVTPGPDSLYAAEYLLATSGIDGDP